jgi:ankyrin repeat protein
VTSTSEDEKSLADMISVIMDNANFDFNARDLSGDTALTIVCDHEKMKWIAKKLIANPNVDVNQANEFTFTPLTICLNAKNFDILAELGKRPDLQVREEDKQLAKSLGINLDDYIKPDDSFLEDVSSMESLLSELEAASVAAG